MDADIAEEVARIYGYDTIPITLPSQTDFTPKKNMDLYWRGKVRMLLTDIGFLENVTSPFVGMDLIKKSNLEKEEHLQLRNPLTTDQEYMRRNLLPQLLETVKKNLPVTNRMRLYEINKLFVPQGNDQPREPYYLTGLALGDDYRVIKGFVETLFDELGITHYSFAKYPRKEDERCGFFDSLFHPNKTAQIFNRDNPTEIWGTLGYIHPTVAKNFAIESELIAFDIPMEIIIKYAVATKIYKPISSYPPVIEDITIDAKDRELGPIVERIKQSSKLISNVELIDAFETKKTFRITFQDFEKNLTEQDVRTIIHSLVSL
jgi:phenylalanyl-tRNA synthetase beta chain